MKKLSILIAFCAIALISVAQKYTSKSWYVKDYTEQVAKAYLDGNEYLLPIEGIWQSNDGFKYAIEKDVENGQRLSTQFRMIVLESSSNGWSRGNIKGFISFGSVDDVYSMKYYTRRFDGTDTSTQQVILVQENPILLSFTRIDSGDKIMLYRLYPQATSDELEGGSASYHNNEDKQWSGSGIAIASKYVATNYHVVEDAQTLVITGINGNTNKNYDVEIVATDKFNDLAILKVTDNTFAGFQTIKYGFSTTTKDLGTDVFVLGCPLISTMGEDIKLTNGIISAKTGFQGDVSLYQISAPVQPGNSGGPLFDDNGDLIGIVNAKHNGAENVGYAIKLLYLKNLIESADLHISLASQNAISTIPLKDKVKAISPMVVMIKANVTSSGPQSKTTKPVTNNAKPSAQQISRVEELFKKVQELMQRGENEEAYKYIQQCNELYQTDRTMLLQGYIAQSIGENEAAINAYEYCIEKEYEVEFATLQLGKLYSEIDKDKALYHFTKCIKLNNRNIEAYFGRALILGHTDDAIKDYKQVIKYGEIAEDNFSNRYHVATSYNNIAYAYLCLGITDNRINENITSALEVMKIMDFIWDTDGEYAYKAGEYLRCINSMNNAIAIAKTKKDKDHANSYLYRGLAYLKLGNTLHAYLDLERAAELKDSTAQEEIKKIDVSTLDFSQEPKSKMIKKPSVKRGKPGLTIEAVEISDECTILYFSSESNDQPSYSIQEKTYIRDNKTGIKYPLIATENCSIYELSGWATHYKNGKARFQLYFPKLPNDVTTIDFIEPEDSEWKIYGINLK